MNAINRLEENWTPSWDLGLQNEFCFMDETEKEEAVELPPARSGWEMASREVFNRQGRSDRRLDMGASSIGDLVTFFESLNAEGGER